MGAMTVLWSFLGVLKHLLAPFALPMFITIKKIIILHLFLGVPAATVGGTGTPWHTRGYAPGCWCIFKLLQIISTAQVLSTFPNASYCGKKYQVLGLPP